MKQKITKLLARGLSAVSETEIFDALLADGVIEKAKSKALLRLAALGANGDPVEITVAALAATVQEARAKFPSPGSDPADIGCYLCEMLQLWAREYAERVAAGKPLGLPKPRKPRAKAPTPEPVTASAPESMVPAIAATPAVGPADQLWGNCVQALRESGCFFSAPTAPDSWPLRAPMAVSGLLFDLLLEGRNDETFFIFAYLPVTAPPEKRALIAGLAMQANWNLLEGCFEMQPSKGWVRFRVSAPAQSCSSNQIQSLISVAVRAVGEHGPSLMAALYAA